MTLKKLLLEGLSLWKIEVLLKTNPKINKIDIYNQLRAVEGVVVLNIKHSDFLDKKSSKISEFSLVYIKFISRTKPDETLALMKRLMSAGDTKINGLMQFIPRYQTLTQIGKY